jgi:hypothetical protein
MNIKIEKFNQINFFFKKVKIRFEIELHITITYIETSRL